MGTYSAPKQARLATEVSPVLLSEWSPPSRGILGKEECGEFQRACVVI